jgi:hypothetical protein
MKLRRFASRGAAMESTGIAFDIVGNLYIADTFEDRIRVVSTDGLIPRIRAAN